MTYRCGIGMCYVQLDVCFFFFFLFPAIHGVNDTVPLASARGHNGSSYGLVSHPFLSGSAIPSAVPGVTFLVRRVHAPHASGMVGWGGTFVSRSPFAFHLRLSSSQIIAGKKAVMAET